MASSTTIPIANINANSVSKLMEYPNKFKKKKVPIMETGTAIAGIIVDLTSCKKIKTTTNTNRNASTKDLVTLSIEAVKNSLVSYGIYTSIPSGKSFSSILSSFFIFSIIF